MLHKYDLESAESAILKIAGDAKEAESIVQYLCTVNWQQVIDSNIQQKNERVTAYMERFQKNWVNGGGYCDECGDECWKLYCWPFASSDDERRKGNFPLPLPTLRDPELIEKMREWNCKEKEYKASQWNETYAWCFHRFCKKCMHKQKREMRVPLSLLFCEICDRLILNRKIYNVRTRTKTVTCCIHCIELVAETQFIHCNECGKKTASFFSSDLCYDCKVVSPYQWQVSSHLSRARAAGTPATLTYKEWESSVAYFGNKCAYCRHRPFEVLEHYMPIALKGGTTFDNCVPACHTCNSIKGSCHPDRLSILLFPEKNLEIIKKYLYGEKQITSPLNVNCRSLMIVK